MRIQTIFQRAVLLAALVLPLSVTALHAQERQSKEEKQQAIRKIEEDLAADALKNDSTRLEKLLAKDFVNVDPGGKMQGAAEMMADMKSGAFKVTEYKLENLKVRLYGNTAVATYIVDGKGTFKDQDVSGRYVTTDVFVFRKGEWKIASSQTTKVATEAKAGETEGKKESK